MLKVSIKNKISQQITNQAQFETQDQVDAWVAECESVEAFGKPEHTIELTPMQTIYHEATLPVLDEEGEELEPAVEAYTEVIEATYEVVPSEYLVEIEDMTEQLEKEKRMKDIAEAGAKARASCDAALDHVAGYNLMRELTPEQITTMTQTFSTIMTLLSVARRPGQAKLMIEAVQPDGIIVTEELKEDLLEILADY